ncbi:MAG: SHOCT domain-containing protein [Nitriliruptorales bacterium]|nr:SHOCT domain-containing protein [Nitriliruptorales bacterium]
MPFDPGPARVQPAPSISFPRQEKAIVMWGSWGWYWVWMAGFWIVVLVAVAWVVVRLGSSPTDDGSRSRQILDERFARGEITEDEYRRKRDTLVER